MRCIMKQYLFFALATFLFVACGSNSQKSIEYVKQTSNDKTYSIDVPKSASRNQCVSSLMSFINEQSHLFIVVDKTNMTPSEYDASQKQDPSFTRTVMEDNDSILIIKSTRGTMNAWSAYNCIGKTEIDGTGYIITVNSDTWSMQTCREVLVHMMSSVKDVTE